MPVEDQLDAIGPLAALSLALARRTICFA